MKKIIPYFVVFLISALFVGAYGFDVEYTDVETDIYMTEPAVFDVTVTNNEDFENLFRISVPDFTSWSSDTKPQGVRLSGIRVAAGSEGTFKLLLYPRNVMPGRKAVQVLLKSDNTGEQIGKYLNVNVKSEFAIPKYEPNLRVETIFPNGIKFDPREEQRIRIKIKNKNALTLRDIKIDLKSNLIDTTTYLDELDPLETEFKDFVISFDSVEEPQQDTLIVTVQIINKTFVAIEDYEIIGYQIPFKEELTIYDKFLRTDNVIKVTNIGNSVTEDKVKFRTTFFKGLITSTKPRAQTIKEDGSRFIMWEFELEPGEIVEARVTHSYRSWIILLILIVVVWVGYYLFRSPIVVLKSASSISMKEGGINEFKVVMHVKNRTHKPVLNIRVIDRVPKIAHVIEEFDVGILKPSKIIKHEKRGTILKWAVDSLESNDEVIISYRIKSRLSILGQFSMPRSIARYSTAKGGERLTTSNVLRLSV